MRKEDFDNALENDLYVGIVYRPLETLLPEERLEVDSKALIAYNRLKEAKLSDSKEVDNKIQQYLQIILYDQVYATILWKKDENTFVDCLRHYEFDKKFCVLEYNVPLTVYCQKNDFYTLPSMSVPFDPEAFEIATFLSYEDLFENILNGHREMYFCNKKMREQMLRKSLSNSFDSEEKLIQSLVQKRKEINMTEIEQWFQDVEEKDLFVGVFCKEVAELTEEQRRVYLDNFLEILEDASFYKRHLPALTAAFFYNVFYGNADMAFLWKKDDNTFLNCATFEEVKATEMDPDFCTPLSFFGTKEELHFDASTIPCTVFMEKQLEDLTGKVKADEVLDYYTDLYFREKMKTIEVTPQMIDAVSKLAEEEWNDSKLLARIPGFKLLNQKKLVKKGH